MKKIKNIFLKEYETSEENFFDAKDIVEIEKFNKISKAEIFEIKAKNCVRAKQFVGILKVNNKNITVLPKIFDKKESLSTEGLSPLNIDEEKKEEKNYIIKNLLVMLSYTKKLNIKESDIAKLGKTDTLLEVFIYIFAKELIGLLKKDFKKNYNDISENSSFLKWKLLFAQHIKNNLFNKSKFFIKYENMDENILLNIFLKSCSEKLLKITNSRENYKLLKKINFILQDIDSRNFQNISSLKTIKLNKQNNIYKWVFSLAKMLYFWNSPDFSKNNQDNFSILFDMNILFEEFLSEFMKKNITKINKKLLSINSQVANKYVFKENKFNLRPDILLKYKNSKKIIIDTKYKKLINNKNKNFWVSSSDIYQMFMYGMRYFEEQEERKIILLYPEYWEKIDSKDFYISEEKIEIFIKTIKLNFDLSNKEWKEDLIRELIDILEF